MRAYCRTGSYAAAGEALGVTKHQVCRLLGEVYLRLGLVEEGVRGQGRAAQAAYMLWGPERIEWERSAPRNKLDFETAQRVREMLELGKKHPSLNPTNLAQWLNVSERTIRQIRDNAIWKVPEAPGRPVASETT